MEWSCSCLVVVLMSSSCARVQYVFHGFSLFFIVFQLFVHGFSLFFHGCFMTFHCFVMVVHGCFMVFHETVFQRTGFQRTGRSRLSIGRSWLFRSIGNAMAFLAIPIYWDWAFSAIPIYWDWAFSAIPIYWDWAFPMNGFWISPNTRDFWLNGLRRKPILKNDPPKNVFFCFWT